MSKVNQHILKPTYAVIGAGQMGGALVAGWIKGRRPVVAPEELILINPSVTPIVAQVTDLGGRHLTTPNAQLGSVEVVLLAVKPQVFPKMVDELAAVLPGSCLIISVMAGVTLATMRDHFPTQPLVRAMPNTPSAIGAGATAFVGTDNVDKAQTQLVKRLLKASGLVREVATEGLIDAVTAISGSGPAYVFYMVEALQAAGENLGLSQEMAQEFARQTIIGAGKLLATSAESAADLRRNVTSPGGTTEAALDVLMRHDGLAMILRDAVNAAQKRAKELGQR